MALRIEQSVVRGEIRSSRRNSISGWIEIRRHGMKDGLSITETVVATLSLVGNLDGQLDGRDFRFRVREGDSSDMHSVQEQSFHLQQVGVIGDSAFRMVRVPLIPIEEFLLARQRGDAAPEELRMSIYLEWYSQNGRVVMELLDPEMEFDGGDSQLADCTPDDLPETDPALPPSITTILRGDDGTIEVFDNSPDSVLGEDDLQEETDDAHSADDEYGLFESNFEQLIRESAFSDVHEAETTSQTHWDELIPGIPPAIKALYEQWDEVLHGEHDQPLTSLFEEPLRLPIPDDLTSEKQAWEALSSLLGAMAIRGVGVEMCPHLSAAEAYRMLVTDLLPEVRVHPNLLNSGFICHLSTWECCEECQNEANGGPDH